MKYAMQPQRNRLPALSILSLLAWCSCLPLVACGASSPSEVILHRQTGEPIHVRVEIADTPEKRQLGLMYRKDLPPDHGMLFLFPRETPQSFWMKNTVLPLDIIYINTARTIVSIAKDTTPFSEQPIPSGQPAQYVLEVNAGFCERHGIVSGDRIEFVRVNALPS